MFLDFLKEPFRVWKARSNELATFTASKSLKTFNQLQKPASWNVFIFLTKHFISSDLKHGRCIQARHEYDQPEPDKTSYDEALIIARCAWA